MRRISALIIILCSAIRVHAQQDPFSSAELVFYGVDFSRAALIGDFGTGSGEDLKNNFIPSLNHLIPSEPTAFRLAQVFKRDILYDMVPVTKSTAKIDGAALLRFESTELTDADLEAIIQQYEDQRITAGVGLVLIIEVMDKLALEPHALIHVTFFDIKTRRLLSSQKMWGKPSGIGYRNYWAGAIKHILKQLQEGRFSTWKQEYARQHQ